MKTLIFKIPNKGLSKRVPRKRRLEFPELENIQSTAKNLLQQVVPGDGLEVVNDLMVDDDVEVGREVNFKAISFEYGGDLLKSSADQITVVSVEEQTLEVEKSEDEASQSKESNEGVEQNKEVVEGRDDDDKNSQNKPDPEKVIKEMVIDQTNDEKNLVDQVWSIRKDELSPEAKNDNMSTYMRIGEENVCLNALYTLYLSQWLDNEVIDVNINALIQYFDTQHRARPYKERIVLADIFACQYIGRDFNVWTRNMSSPK
ncbi:hypothetical protein GIB67_017161, partial [Kingdonia uniflora]